MTTLGGIAVTPLLVASGDAALSRLRSDGLGRGRSRRYGHAAPSPHTRRGWQGRETGTQGGAGVPAVPIMGTARRGDAAVSVLPAGRWDDRFPLPRPVRVAPGG